MKHLIPLFTDHSCLPGEKHDGIPTTTTSLDAQSHHPEKNFMNRSLLELLLIAVPLVLSVGCHSHKENLVLRTRVDSLQEKLDAAYVPGTGEIMNNIVQPHHLKLWLAATDKNWALAEYELYLMSGGFKRIEKFHKASPEATAVTMIYPQIDSVQAAINSNDEVQFKKQYLLLNATCNKCHQATEHPFIVIKVPDQQEFSDQDL